MSDACDSSVVMPVNQRRRCEQPAGHAGVHTCGSIRWARGWDDEVDETTLDEPGAPRAELPPSEDGTLRSSDPGSPSVGDELRSAAG